jgi:hypothetical protein
MEMVASLHCAAHGDFAEGIRALLIDKDRNRTGTRPRWPRPRRWAAASFASPWPPARIRWPTSAPHFPLTPQEDTTMSRIAFIGLGNMGGRWPQPAQGRPRLRVFDLNRPPWPRPSPAPVAAADAAEAVHDAEVVISMLPASRHVEGLYLGENGCWQDPGRRVGDRLQHHRARHRRARSGAAGDRGLAMIDAPVSGGTAGTGRHADLHRRRP